MTMSLSTGFSRALRLALLAGALALVCLGPASWGGTLEAVAVTDSQVKAAYLYNFANFVQWPSHE